MFRRLLVAFDGSAQAHQAMCEAVDLASRGNASLTVLTVVPPSSGWALAGGWLPPLTPPALGDELEGEYQSRLDAAVHAMPADLPVTRILRHGVVGSAIAEEAGNGKYDLIILGSHVHGELRSRVFGSVVQHVLHKSPVPVLVVRDAALADESRA